MREFLCAAVLFDLDGVLVDSRGAVERQWSIWAAAHGLDPPRVLHVAHGRPTVETVRVLAPEAVAEAEAAQIKRGEIADLDGVRAVPGAAELLAMLPPERWAVATSGTRALATARLSHTGLPMPRVLVPADEVAKGKPSAEPYVRAASLLGFPPTHCVVVEDAPAGVCAARAAGAQVIAVPTTYPIAELGAADVIAENLAAIRADFDSGASVLRLRVEKTADLRQLPKM